MKRKHLLTRWETNGIKNHIIKNMRNRKNDFSIRRQITQESRLKNKYAPNKKKKRLDLSL